MSQIMRTLTVMFAFILLVGTRVANGQLVATLEAGGSSTKDWTASNYNAAIVNSSAQLIRTYTRVDAYAGYEAYSGGSGFGQGSAYGYLYTPQKGLLSGEFSVMGAAATYDGIRSASYLGTFRGYLWNAKGGVWLGAGAGKRHYTLDSLIRNVTKAEVGGWAQRKQWTFTSSITPTSIGDVRYTDAEAKTDLFFRKIDVSIALGFREGEGVPDGSSKWWGSLTSTFWVMPLVGISASVGSYPYDVSQDYPGARYVNVLFKLRSSIPPRDVGEEKEIVADESVDPIFTVSMRRDQKRLRIRAEGATGVQVMGAFTDWVSRAMVPLGTTGWWELDIPLNAGVYHMNYKVDEGEWSIPAGMAIEDDEFNGKVGVLIVEENVTLP